MDLLRKLARLGDAGPGATPGAAPEPAPPLGGAGRTEASGAVPGSSVPVRAEAADVLDELRRKMAEILGREAPSPATVPEVPFDGLPFQRCEASPGVLFRRSVRLRPSHHVGRMPVDGALAARCEVLALLALDPGLAGCDLARALYIDTESTGLAGAGTVAFLIGTCRFEAGSAVMEQLMLRRPGEERAMLDRVRELVADASLVVSYNGKSFDWPLLQSRCVMNRLPPLPERPHLDLLHIGRRLHRARLGACRLVTLEADVLGFVRGEDIDGAEVPARYSHYLRTGDAAALRAVVDHNEWDVLSMAALVALYGEPLEVLHEEDLVGLARTLKRAGAFEQAVRAADAAVERGAGAEALRVRGAIAKARGDRASALRDFEALGREVDDPRVRLELAKLYEHHVKEPLQALEQVRLGTGEGEEAQARRRARLERKLGRGSTSG